MTKLQTDIAERNEFIELKRSVKEMAADIMQSNVRDTRVSQTPHISVKWSCSGSESR